MLLLSSLAVKTVFFNPKSQHLKFDVALFLFLPFTLHADPEKE